MKSNISKRLDDIENRTLDWAAQLDVVDYGVLEVIYDGRRVDRVAS